MMRKSLKKKNKEDYNQLNKDTSKITLGYFDILLYKLFLVEPTGEIRLKIHRYNSVFFDEIGTMKYYYTHLLIAQYFQINGKLYSEYEYRKLMYQLNERNKIKNKFYKKMRLIKFFLKKKKNNLINRRIMKLKEKIK